MTTAGLVFQQPWQRHGDAFNPISGAREPLLPLLFVTVACGACSGFHALVASGTTSKQLDRESHIRPVAYGGMWVEGLLALVALVAAAWMTQADFSAALKEHGPVMLFAKGIAGFAARFGMPLKTGEMFISLALAAFLMTTLDTATRLARFTWQELFLPRRTDLDADAPQPKCRALTNRYSATLLACLAAGWLLLGGGSKSFWPVFASSNQLLAALTLLGASLWLLRHKRGVWIALLPMCVMLLTSCGALISIFTRNLRVWQEGSFATGGVMTLASGALFLLAVALLVFSVASLRRGER